MSRPIALALLLVSCGIQDAGPGVSVGGPPGASGSRLKLQFLESPDGARLPQGLWDAEMKEDCVPRTAEDGLTRCIPTSAATIWGSEPKVFSDPACKTPALVVALTGACAPRYLIKPLGDAVCATDFRVRVLRVVSAEAVYVSNGGDCQPFASYMSFTAEVVPTTAFALMTKRAL